MMQVTQKQIHEWHEAGVRIAESYKRNGYQLIEILRNMAASKGYYLFNCQSLKEYATVIWDLSENVSSDLVIVANKAVEFPEILEVLKERKTTVSKVRKVCPVITAEDSKDWLDLACKGSSRTIERSVAMARRDLGELPEFDIINRKLANLVHLLPEDLATDLDRVRDLLSQKLNASASMIDALRAMAKSYLERHDPIQKAGRAKAKAERRQTKAWFEMEQAAESQQCAAKPTETATETDAATVQEPTVTGRSASEEPAKSTTPKKSSKRKKVSTTTVHTVNLRDEVQCTEIGPDGKRCQNRRWIQLHHIVPVSQGGSDEIENLRTICAGHHRAHHFREELGLH